MDHNQRFASLAPSFLPLAGPRTRPQQHRFDHAAQDRAILDAALHP
jgi:hypothetical protein